MFLSPTKSISGGGPPSVQLGAWVRPPAVSKNRSKCTHFFDIIFPINVFLKIANEYFRQVNRPSKTASGRFCSSQADKDPVSSSRWLDWCRSWLLVKAGINPMGARVEILQAELRGADYIAVYQPR